MAKTRKVVTKLNLNKLNVFIEDVKTYSDYFSVSQFNRNLTSGKNSFLISGTSYLQPRSEIFIEILDSNGDPVFINPVSNYSEGGGRLISAEIYEDTPSGPGTLVVVGTLDATKYGVFVPLEFRDSPNVRWVSPITIEPKRKNTSPIRFYKTPELFVSELTGSKSIVDRVIQSSSAFTLSLTPQIINATPTGHTLSSASPFFVRDMLNGKIVGAIQKTITTQSISASISTDTQTVLNAAVNVPIYSILNSNRAATRTNILDQNKALFPISELSNSITSVTESIVTHSQDIYSVYTTVLSQSLELQYPIDLIATSSVNNVFSEIRIINLNTISGEVARIKTFVREANSVGDFNLVADTQPTAQDFLRSGELVDTGQFTSSSLIDTTWFSDITTNSSYVSGSTTSSIAIVTGSSTRLLDGAHFLIVDSALTSSYFLGSRDVYTFFTGSEYTLSYDVYMTKTSGSYTYPPPSASVGVYLYGSGSANRSSNVTSFGIPIDILNLYNKDIALIQNRTVNFTVRQNMDAYLRFTLDNAFYTLANIRVKTAEEFGFNSDEVRMVVPVDAYASASLVFKSEFYDINNNSVNLDVISPPTNFVAPAPNKGSGSGFPFSGSAVISGSLIVTGGISGSVLGESSGGAGVAIIMDQSDGGLLTTGYRGTIRIPTDVVISKVSMYTSGSGSIDVDIQKQTHTTFDPLPASGVSIVGTPLSITNDTKYEDTVLSGWTTNLLADDLLNFYIISASGAELRRATVNFEIVADSIRFMPPVTSSGSSGGGALAVITRTTDPVNDFQITGTGFHVLDLGWTLDAPYGTWSTLDQGITLPADGYYMFVGEFGEYGMSANAKFEILLQEDTATDVFILARQRTPTLAILGGPVVLSISGARWFASGTRIVAGHFKDGTNDPYYVWGYLTAVRIT